MPGITSSTVKNIDGIIMNQNPILFLFSGESDARHVQHCSCMELCVERRESLFKIASVPSGGTMVSSSSLKPRKNMTSKFVGESILCFVCLFIVGVTFALQVYYKNLNVQVHHQAAAMW